jgi:hypothetical protein
VELDVPALTNRERLPDIRTGRSPGVTILQRVATAAASATALFLIASLRLPLAYWTSPSGRFDLLGILGMSVAIAAGRRYQKPVGPVFRWLAGTVAVCIGLATAFLIRDVLTAPKPPTGSLAIADYTGLLAAMFGYAAVRGRNWF